MSGPTPSVDDWNNGKLRSDFGESEQERLRHLKKKFPVFSLGSLSTHTDKRTNETVYRVERDIRNFNIVVSSTDGHNSLVMICDTKNPDGLSVAKTMPTIEVDQFIKDTVLHS